MRFRKDNQIRYGQDHAFYRGIPPGIDFKVERSDTLWVLRACGYGCMAKHSPKCYGNGALYPYRLTTKQRKRLERERGGNTYEVKLS